MGSAFDGACNVDPAVVLSICSDLLSLWVSGWGMLTILVVA